MRNILQSLWRYREPLSLCICILHAHRTNMDVLYVTWIYNYTSVYLYHLYTDTLSFLGRRAAVWLCCLHDWLVRSSSKAGTWDHSCRMPETMSRCLGRDRTPMSLVFWDRVQRASYSGFWRMLRHQGQKWTSRTLPIEMWEGVLSLASRCSQCSPLGSVSFPSHRPLSFLLPRGARIIQGGAWKPTGWTGRYTTTDSNIDTVLQFWGL